jgi:crotonobetainyl-CoA:carnitine CoA-transferase CaiB-like acyl-CoA transferase
MMTLTHAEPGTVEHPGLPVRLHATPGQVHRPAGPPGEANEMVFCKLLGLSSEELARFVAAGVIA